MVTGNFKINDIDLRGTRLIYQGDCNSWGVKATTKVKIPKRELICKLFKFEDDKKYKECKVNKKGFLIYFDKKYISKFLTEQKEENE